MKNQFLTKVLLVCASVALLALAAHLFVPSTAHAQTTTGGKFSHLVLSGSIGGFWLFDSKTGDIWVYSSVDDKVTTEYIGRLVEPGKPLTKKGE